MLYSDLVQKDLVQKAELYSIVCIPDSDHSAKSSASCLRLACELKLGGQSHTPLSSRPVSLSFKE